MPSRSRAGVRDVLTQIEQWVGPQGPPGVGAAVWKDGEVIAEHFAGNARATIR